MATPDLGQQMTDRELAALEKRIAKLYSEAGDELQETIDEYFENFFKRDAEMKSLIGTIQNGKEWTEQDYKQWRLAQIGRGKRFEAMRDKVARRATDVNEVARAYINDTTPGIYSLNRNYAAYTIEQVSGSVGFDLWDEQTVKRLIKEQPELMPYYPPERALKRGIDLAWGKKQITASVTSSILQGKGIKGMADDLQRRITDMSRDSAIRTARTAVTGAQNAGRMDSYTAAEKMGIELKKEWLATLDGRTRHSHAVLDGEKQDNDKPFSNGCMFPGDPSGPAAEVYNCRCTLIAEIPGQRQNGQRRARDPATGKSVLIKDMTYAEWAGWKRLQPAPKPAKIKPVVQQQPNQQQQTPKVDLGMYPKELGGAQRGKEMSFSEADSFKVNPKYGTGQGYDVNCQSCVVAFEARRRGYDVYTKSNYRNPTAQRVARDTNLAWIDPKTGKNPQYIFDSSVVTPEAFLDFMKKTVEKDARYTLQFAWKGGNSGHIVNLDLDDAGQLRIKDNQRGQGEINQWVGDKRVLEYIEKMRFTSAFSSYKYAGPQMLRIDNLRFDVSIVDKLVKGY